MTEESTCAKMIKAFRTYQNHMRLNMRVSAREKDHAEDEALSHFRKLYRRAKPKERIEFHAVWMGEK